MDMGPTANERRRQTVCSIRWSIFLRGSSLFGAGVWEFPHRNFEIFGFGGTIWTHGSSYRPAMHMGVLVY